MIYAQATQKNNDSLIKILRKYSGIVCSSKSFSSPIMWSHYSECHKGIVLGYEVSSELKVDLFRVLYRHRKAIIDDTGRDVKNNPKLALKFLNLKSKDWKYEKEVRAFFYLIDCIEVTDKEQLLFFIDCKEKGLVLKEVILGVNSNLDSSEISMCVENVDIYKASLCKNTFTVLRTLQMT